jgi:hypothetical protein
MMKQTFIFLFFLLAARVRCLEMECNLLIFSNITGEKST